MKYDNCRIIEREFVTESKGNNFFLLCMPFHCVYKFCFTKDMKKGQWDETLESNELYTILKKKKTISLVTVISRKKLSQHNELPL